MSATQSTHSVDPSVIHQCYSERGLAWGKYLLISCLYSLQEKQLKPVFLFSVYWHTDIGNINSVCPEERAPIHRPGICSNCIHVCQQICACVLYVCMCLWGFMVKIATMWLSMCMLMIWNANVWFSCALDDRLEELQEEHGLLFLLVTISVCLHTS